MDYSKRIRLLQDHLKKRGSQALLIMAERDLYYLVGKIMSAGKLLVFPERAILFVDTRYIEECKAIEHVEVSLEKPDSILNVFKKEVGEGKFSFDSQKLNYQLYLHLKDTFSEVKPFELDPWPNPVQDIRSIKDSKEIEKMREAAFLGSLGYDFVCSQLKEGVTEKQLAQALHAFWWKEGGQGASFDPIIAFGESTSMPHYHLRDIPLKKNQAVLIDIGVKLNEYCSDMTRVVFFGDSNDQMKEIYQVVWDAHELALQSCRPGVKISDLDGIARNHISEQGFGEYFGHALGHGIGLEVHECFSVSAKASSDLLLREGMVLTVEPGIYLPSIGGVRIENTVVITKDGYEDLTCRSKDFIYLS